MTFHVNAVCFCLVNHPKTLLHYWFKCARVRHSLCCFHAGVSESIGRNSATERRAGPLVEIRHHQKSSATFQHKPDTLDSVEQLDPRCAQLRYESFGDEGEKRRQFLDRKRKTEMSYTAMITCSSSLCSLLVHCVRSSAKLQNYLQTETCSKCTNHKHFSTVFGLKLQWD